MEKAKGSTFLKATGVLMIIGGSLNIILGIIAVLGVAALAAFSEGTLSSGLLTTSSILVLVSGIIQLITGIIGVKNSNKPAKAKICIIWAIIVVVLSLLGNILTVVAGSSLNVFSLLLGLALPVLYIVGAYLNLKQSPNQK